MELDITAFFNSAAPREYSASVAEIGANAGPDTWRAACCDAPDYPILDTEEKRDAFRAFVRESGGWSAEEIAAWSDAELTALCLQWISGDMREPVGFELGTDTTPEQWAEYERQANAGKCSGRIFLAGDGRVFFDCGS